MLTDVHPSFFSQNYSPLWEKNFSRIQAIFEVSKVGTNVRPGNPKKL
eukprot:gene8073-2811_t